MPELKKYHRKVGWSKAIQRIWRQEELINGKMVRKCVSYKPKRQRMRTLKLANWPDGKVKMLCLMTKKRAEELKRDGVSVELLAPVDVVSGTSRCRVQKGKMRSEFTLYDFRLMSEALLSSGGKISTVDDSSQREEMHQLYWSVVEIAQKMERVIKSMPDEDKRGPGGLFRDFVDEEKMAKALMDICLNFYGIDKKAELTGTDKSRITLTAYLFILIEHEGLGCDTFSEKGVAPFYRFIKGHVMTNLDATPRTLHNRLRGKMSSFRKHLREEPRNSKFQNVYWQTSPFLPNFLKVREIFHATDYYKVLKPLLAKAL